MLQKLVPRFLGPEAEVSAEAEPSSAGPAGPCVDQLQDGQAGRLQLDKVTSRASNEDPHEAS